MKQLELTVKIEQIDDSDYPYMVTVRTKNTQECSSWYRGKTIQEVMKNFYKSFGDSNLRCWYLLRDK